MAYALQVVKNLNKLIGLMVFLGFIIAVYAIWQHYTGIDLWRSNRILLSNQYGGVRVYQSYGLFSHHLTFADSYLMLVVFPFATLLLSSKWEIWKRFLALIVFGTFLAAILFTYSRGAWIALAVALPVMAFFVSRKLLLWFLLLAAILGGGFLKYDTALKNRAMSIFEVSTSQKEAERRQIWGVNMQMFRDNPWLGVGYKQNEPLASKYYEKMGIKDGFSGHAHSNYLEVLSTTGIIGTVFYMLFILAFVLMTARLYSSIPKTHFWHRVFTLAILGGQIAFHVSGLTQCNFQDGEVQHQFCFWLAVMSYMSYRYYAHIVPDDRSL